ncbi:hypothetical protein [Flavobacterium psychrophilum]|uniref:hypothetical protein n=1 Tax=Flavobacterium psychrophilum TaxID=96345 RepID=UPI00106BD14A|nr:hypothetical protein [Flavobacterium psychrophilum]
MRGKIFTIVVTRVDSALNDNVSQLGDVADFQHQTFTNIDKILIHHLSFQKITEPAISPNCC